ncbi:MAG TPA: 3-isopropylmalate dehydratase small subunit [Acidimicrobiia bacterium]
MNPVNRIVGAMVPLPRADVDTDQIIPKQFLKRIERTGYGEFLFYDWARDRTGALDPGFVLNEPLRRQAKILLAGANFGCGSSREHAVWAIQDWGFAAVIAPSFADIFRNNSINVGLLPVQVNEDVLQELLVMAQSEHAELTIDLNNQTLTAEGVSAFFDIEADAKRRLLAGLDSIGETLELADEISAFESTRPEWMPVATV